MNVHTEWTSPVADLIVDVFFVHGRLYFNIESNSGLSGDYLKKFISSVK